MKRVALAALLSTAMAAPAMAHHSFAMFDHDKTAKVTGTVKQFEWLNPHSWVHVVSMEPNGKAVTWAFEAGSTGQLAARGWKASSLKPGDKITISFHPLKDGSHGGQVLTVVLPNGSSLSQGRDTLKKKSAGG